METTQGIFLYSYLHLFISFYLIYFFFNKIGEQEGGTGCAQRHYLGVTQIMYTQVSKCENNKIIFRKTAKSHFAYWPSEPHCERGMDA
jgi:hypothetical protein